jgi:hypothetical protein
MKSSHRVFIAASALLMSAGVSPAAITIVPATSRRICLMQDRLYRLDAALQAMGYLYPPQLGGKIFPASAPRTK